MRYQFCRVPNFNPFHSTTSRFDQRYSNTRMCYVCVPESQFSLHVTLRRTAFEIQGCQNHKCPQIDLEHLTVKAYTKNYMCPPGPKFWSVSLYDPAAFKISHMLEFPIDCHVKRPNKNKMFFWQRKFFLRPSLGVHEFGDYFRIWGLLSEQMSFETFTLILSYMVSY